MIRLSGWLVAALVLLAATAWLGLRNGLHQFSQATTVGQELETVSELAYGVLGALACGALLTARRWAVIVVLGWGAAVTAACALAAASWGGAGWGAALAAGMSGAVVALFVVWLAKRALAPS